MAFLGSLAGGSGVLLGRDAFGQWSSPAFYEMGRGGFGMQAGISSGALVYLFFDRDYMLSGLDQGFDLAMDTDVVVFSSVDRTGVSKLATQRPVLLYSEMLGMYLVFLLMGDSCVPWQNPMPITTVPRRLRPRVLCGAGNTGGLRRNHFGRR